MPVTFSSVVEQLHLAMPMILEVCQLFLRIWVIIIGTILKKLLPIERQSLRDDVILITGGSGGLARSLARELIKCNPRRIILWDISQKGLEEAAAFVTSQQIPCDGMVCDLRNREEIYACAGKLQQAGNSPTLVINNAGVVYGKFLLESSDDEIQATFQTNVMASFWTIKAFLPIMNSRGRGHFVFINSVLSYMGLAGAADYVSSKHALVGLYESLLCELQCRDMQNIKLTSIHPYHINTGMFTGCATRFPRLLPMLTPEQVAKRTVTAILKEEQFVCLPVILSCMLYLKSWLPLGATMELYKFLGAITAMEHFNPTAKGPPAKKD